MPRWLRNSFVVAVVAAGALLLWVGFALLVAALLIVAIPFWLWSLFARSRAAEGPVIIESTATRVDDVLEAPAGDEKPRSNAPRDS